MAGQVRRHVINELASQNMLRKWHLVDARDQILGRLSSQIARLLMGKWKPIYDPSADCGDFVVVTNARHIALTGNKLNGRPNGKIYYKHSGYPGGLKETPAKTMLERKPEELIRIAVHTMLPRNRLRNRWEERLRIFPDANHEHTAQRPQPIVFPAANLDRGRSTPELMEQVYGEEGVIEVEAGENTEFIEMSEEQWAAWTTPPKKVRSLEEDLKAAAAAAGKKK
eukprot:tig00020538_g10372.t1